MLRNQQQTRHSAPDEGEIRASKRLWASVVRTAADDLSHGPTDRLYAQAVCWMDSESEEIASFLWCCDILDLNAAAVREKVRSGKISNSNGKYASLLKEFNKTRDEDPVEEV